MKLVRAYVRTYMAVKVIDALKQLDIDRLMIIHSEELERGAEKGLSHLATDVCCECTDMIKIELICPDDLLGQVKKRIIAASKTGYQGDGLIAVSKLEEAVSIRTEKSIISEADT